jgi:hypothetical protein
MANLLDLVPLISCLSYEALPPNFTLLENCLAGAFAGIMVSPPPRHERYENNTKLMLLQEHSVMYPVDLLKVLYHPGEPI